MPVLQKRPIKSLYTLPPSTLEEDMVRQTEAVDADLPFATEEAAI